MILEHALRAGYYRALNGNVLLDSEPVPVFDAYGVPELQPRPFIITSAIQVIEIPNDKCKKYEAFITVDIVTDSQSPATRADTWIIAEQVDDIINPDNMQDIDITINGWRIGETRLSSANNIEDKSENYYIYRNLRTYRHLISKTSINS